MEKKTLGAFIAQLRKDKGLTQKSLAELLNVSDKTVSHWECDENSPDISLLPFLSEALGVSVDELLRGEKRTVQPTAELHYIPPVQESFATRTINKIKSRMTGDISERYRIFRILSLIGTIIPCVVILIEALINLIAGGYFLNELAFIPGIVAFIGSLWTLAISLGLTLGARLAFSKGMLPSPEADRQERKYIYRANGFCFNNLFLVFCTLPVALTGFQDVLGLAVILNIAITAVCLAALWLVLLLVLNKKGILKTDKKKLLAVRYLGIFALSFILIPGSLWFITEEIWFPSAQAVTFDSPEEFKAYMETPKEKPVDSWRIDGVTATIAISDGIIIEDDSDYIRNERVYGEGNEIIVDFAWHNKAVYSYFYNPDDRTFSVITYEAKLNQKDAQIAVDDGVPVAVVIFFIADAVTCFCLYRRKARELTQE